MDQKSRQPRNRDRAGQGPIEEKQFDERVVNVNRVARVVKGGRRFRFQALVVIGDHKGKVGVGVSKGADVTAAVTKAVEVAKKSIVKIELYKNTLTHDTSYKVGGSHILLKPASAGTGIIAGGVVRTVLEVVGVENALSKSLGASNKINTAYATIEALKQTTPQKQWITYSNNSKQDKNPSKKAPAKASK